ncbi:MAG: hypothetical protein ACEQSR_04270 [Candidatus Methylacidiphilales bacterium]
MAINPFRIKLTTTNNKAILKDAKYKELHILGVEIENNSGKPLSDIHSSIYINSKPTEVYLFEAKHFHKLKSTLYSNVFLFSIQKDDSINSYNVINSINNEISIELKLIQNYDIHISGYVMS